MINDMLRKRHIVLNCHINNNDCRRQKQLRLEFNILTMHCTFARANNLPSCSDIEYIRKRPTDIVRNHK